ncbi:MAG: cation-transporting P-type ATPase [Nitrososphaeria archaeon]|jgi:Ca2+-transporting ATPase
MEEDKPFNAGKGEASAISKDKSIGRSSTDFEQGLSQNEAEKRLQEFGLNVVPKIRPNLLRSYVSPLMNWLISIYLIISIILALLAFFIRPRIYGQVFLWLVVIAINAVLIIVQHFRAQINLEALQKLSPSESKVIRDGKIVVIPSEQIVPGDIIMLSAGDKVPADARIISSSYLKVNEAALTGESEEVEKYADNTTEVTHITSNSSNLIFLGTWVTAGSALVAVLKTGKETELAKISRNVEKRNVMQTTLQTKINKIAKYLGFAVLAYLAIAFAHQVVLIYLNHVLHQNIVYNADLIARTAERNLTTAMSIMPINIPLLTTITLLSGALAMAKHKVIIQDLNSIESLGRVSIVCADKTGTMTKNEMTVKWICFPSTESNDLLYGVTGSGYEPEGKIIEINESIGLKDIAAQTPETVGVNVVSLNSGMLLEHLLVSGMLNNDSTSVISRSSASVAEKEKSVVKVIGDATDSSLSILFDKSGLNLEEYKLQFKEILSFPFDSNLKRMSKVFVNKDGGYVTFTKGATETILPMCNFIVEDAINNVREFKGRDKEIVFKKANILASFGYRIISFAFRKSGTLETIQRERNSIERDLTYLGFVAISDPLREDVRESVAEAKDAGIRTVMITGDNPTTAKTIAEQAGIFNQNDLISEGQSLESLSEDEFIRTSVFARISPEHKKIIVDRYKRQGYVVAVTGDGVNDAIALSEADVGVAMGVTGTDVAKESADMIVADDSFSTIITGIREGRGLFEKIRAIIFFYIAVNLAEALVYFGASFLSGFYLLNAYQQIYIFMTAHAIPPFAILIEQLSGGIMKEKPRNTEDIFTKRIIIALLLFSISLAFMLFVTYYTTISGLIPVFAENKLGYVPNFSASNFLNPIDWAQAKARTMLLTVVLIAECTLVISLRRINKSIFEILRENNFWVIWLLILSVPIAHLTLMYIPSIQSILFNYFGINLEIIRLSFIDWIIAIVLGLMPVTLLEIYKMKLKRQGLFF